MVPISEIINPETVVKLDKEGMVRYKKNGEEDRGDLFIQFHIEFPKFLALEDKKTLENIL